mmetsp:Transcript_45441/g.106779  ORF Transcript_45441/g.106779 Transcript_45441/m.106779 type:complete len:104 (+) Transcript_45441:742-1053(+)
MMLWFFFSRSRRNGRILDELACFPDELAASFSRATSSNPEVQAEYHMLSCEIFAMRSSLVARGFEELDKRASHPSSVCVAEDNEGGAGAREARREERWPASSA